MDTFQQKKEEKPSFLTGRKNSFRYALKGLRSLMSSEPNAWIHLTATMAVLMAGYYVSLSVKEWTVLVVVIGMVWVAEIFNTCIEKIMDLLYPQDDPRVGNIKDLAAAAVLCTSLIAVVVGCLVFFPHFISG
jgi:diacylglycerol kinase